jgi:small subunit ribosomal protein S8e
MNKGRKFTGALYHRNRKKRFGDIPSQENKTALGETKRKMVRRKGGHHSPILLKANSANVSDGKKTMKVTIKNVLETPQNKFLARQNRIMKGAIIETDKGKARITNRPSREGVVNATLLE